MRVVLYSRPGCHLCDDARQVLLAAQAERPFELTEVNIEDDHDLERVYGIRIPVIEIDGDDRFEYQVDAVELRRLVREG